MGIKAYEFGNDKYLVEIANDTYEIQADGTEVKLYPEISARCGKILKRVGEKDCTVQAVRCIAGLAYFRHRIETEDRTFWRETLTIPGGKPTDRPKLELVK